jgi:hypothetical protein
MRQFVLIILFTGSLSQLDAQQKTPWWSIGVNPLGLAESLSSIGPCAEYRVSPAISFWAEGSYIFHNLYKIANWKNVKGYRFIFQPRIYLGNSRSFFLAPELRIKQFNYHTTLTFINDDMQDTLTGFFHRAHQSQVGGAFVMGVRSWLSKDHKMGAELTMGVGGKVRYIRRRNVPAGYKFEPVTGGWGLAPHYEWDRDGTVYFPLCIRLVWKLN